MFIFLDASTGFYLIFEMWHRDLNTGIITVVNEKTGEKYSFHQNMWIPLASEVSTLLLMKHNKTQCHILPLLCGACDSA